METDIKPLSVWKHFKGSKAIVLTVAQHSEIGEKLVIYRCLDSNGKAENGVYARPMESFLAEIDHDKYPEISQKHRFEKVLD